MINKRILLCFALLIALTLAAPLTPAQAQQSDLLYTARGPYPVGTLEQVITGEDRPLPITIWYPSQEGDEITTYIHTPELSTLPDLEQPGHAIPNGAPDPSGGPYPLVIFSHGNVWYRQAAAYLAEHLASHGFVVLAADHTGNTLAYMTAERDSLTQSKIDALAYRPGDIQRQIDYTRELTAGDGPLVGMIDPNQIAVIGHSYGGYTALAATGARVDLGYVREWCVETADNPAVNETYFYNFTCNTLASTPDEYFQTEFGVDTGEDGLWAAFDVSGVDAIVQMAPGALWTASADSLADVTIPTLILGAEMDNVAPYDLNAALIYENLPGPDKTLVTFEEADHFLFVEDCFGYFEEVYPKGCGDPVWDVTEAHNLIKHFVTAFLRDALFDDAQAAVALIPDAVDFPGISYATNRQPPD